MNRQEAEEYVYRSYLKAETYQSYDAKDAAKRNPGTTREIIRARAGTPCAVVTGSKGKGSAACMIAQGLQTACRVGLMTSPHLASFCERFRINGEMISDSALVRYMTAIRPEIDAAAEALPPHMCVSPMGIQADLALAWFNDQHTEFNVLECGKGAQYDDVNNALHEYAVINSIFREHTRELGDTAEEIARDKAHVITGEQKCVYTAPQEPSVLAVIRERAERYRTPLKVYGADFRAENIRFTEKGMRFDVAAGGRLFPEISIPLMGEHQARNCALALAVCADVLPEIDADAVRQRMARISWPGRMEVISHRPFILLDACIHPSSCREVLAVMRELKISRATLIAGIPDDKDYAGVIREMLPVSDRIILTGSHNPHYRFTEKRQERLRKEGIRTLLTADAADALRAVCEAGGPTVILGTTSVVAEVKQLQEKNMIPAAEGTEKN